MSEKLPESRIVFQDTTKDGLLTLTVWFDDVLQTDLMRAVGVDAMGTLRIYNNVSLTMHYEERVQLSESSLSGYGPTPEEIDYWSSLIDLFYTDYD